MASDKKKVSKWDEIVTESGKPFDIVVAGGSCTDAADAAGGEQRKGTFLTVDDHPASIQYLREYFRYGRSEEKAARACVDLETKQITLAGPYLQNLLMGEGYTVTLVPHCEGGHLLRLKRILEAGTKTVVLSTSFMYAAELVLMVAGFIKEVAPDATIVAGGTHIMKAWKLKQLVEKGVYNEEHIKMYSSVTHQMFLDPTVPYPVDAFIVNPRGEATLKAVLNKMAAGDESWRDMDNVIHWREGQWQFNPMVEEPYTPIRIDWSKVVDEDNRCFLPVPVASGCPFKCSFCDFWDLHPKETRHPIETVIDNIRSIPVVDGVRRVFFTDDNLIPDKTYGMKFLKILLEADLHMRFISFIRAGTVTEDLAEMLAKCGCTKVMIGVESAALDIQKNMNKVISPDKLVAAITALNKHSISTFNTLICGFPGETEKTFSLTLDTLNRFPTEYPATNEYQFFKFAALPLSRISLPDMRKKFDLQGGYLQWTHKTMDSEGAAELMGTIPARIRPEIGPFFPSETYFLEDPGLTVEMKKQITTLRGKIARVHAGILKEDDAKLWDELEQIFLSTQDKTVAPVLQEASTIAAAPGDKCRPKVDVQKVMSDPKVIKQLMKHPRIWLKVTNPKILGKLLQAAVDPTVLDRDPKLNKLVTKLQKITGIGVEGGAHTDTLPDTDAHHE
eukprot:TRINITY_DN392_c0_g1_i1.p2 TRINITY_DN392_c0_g1~~TRINITY_DN392_c0_g1_i1.p2  ORF type:complete len:674 (-),score=240.82 TRINITY_DN392_c0_g1_i1:722-2743(-)